MDSYCKVINCSNPNKHVTRSHICELCGYSGHGFMECRYPIMREELEQYWDDVIKLNDRCNFIDCSNRNYHTTEEHLCVNCNHKGHSFNTCMLRYKTLNCPICRVENRINIMQRKISGLTDECCICMDNKVEIYFKDCGHVCICSLCFQQL